MNTKTLLGFVVFALAMSCGKFILSKISKTARSDSKTEVHSVERHLEPEHSSLVTEDVIAALATTSVNRSSPRPPTDHETSIQGSDQPEKPWTVKMVSDGGYQQVDVLLSNYVPTYFHLLQERDFGSVLNDLKIAMDSGDEKAAFTGHLLLEECASVPHDDLQYYEGELEVRKELPNRLKGQEFAVDSYSKTYQACLTVSKALRSKSNAWLVKASELGSIAALDKLALNAPSPEETFRFYLESWQLGSHRAAGSLSRAYREGWASPDGLPDHVTAYAYGYLAYYLNGSSSTSHRTRQHSITQLNLMIPISGGVADSTTQKLGTELAFELIRANPNCCMRY